MAAHAIQHQKSARLARLQQASGRTGQQGRIRLAGVATACRRGENSPRGGSKYASSIRPAHPGCSTASPPTLQASPCHGSAWHMVQESSQAAGTEASTPNFDDPIMVRVAGSPALAYALAQLSAGSCPTSSHTSSASLGWPPCRQLSAPFARSTHLPSLLSASVLDCLVSPWLHSDDTA